MKSSNSILEKVSNTYLLTSQVSLFSLGIAALTYYNYNLEGIAQVDIDTPLRAAYYGTIVPFTLFFGTLGALPANRFYTQRIVDYFSKK